MVTLSGAIANEKGLPTSVFKQYVTLWTWNTGNLRSIEEGNVFIDSVFSRICLLGTV